MGAPKPLSPVIVIPGITASTLRDEYALDAERVWTALRRRFERVALHPEDLRYERQEPARVVRGELFDIPYSELIADLRHDLSPAEDRPTPVFAFPYDWRQPLDRIEEELALFVDEVIDRTALLPHYHDAGYHKAPAVTLVGHSMGGLIIAGYLDRYGEEAAVDKVATLGTPFRGSIEAMARIATGLSTLGGRSASREREVARLTPSLYSLLPSFRGAIRAAEDGASISAFSPEAWQRSVVETIAEYFRLHAADRGLREAGGDEAEQRRRAAARRKAAETLFRRLLADGERSRRRLEALDLAACGLRSGDWLCIVGIGSETRVRLRIIRNRDDGAQFDLRSLDRVDALRSDLSARSTETGDGTVAYLGAQSAFIPREELVCVSRAEFGYWEIADRALEGPLGVGLHGMLPRMNMAQKLIAAHLKGGVDAVRDGVRARRAPDLALEPGLWKPPIPGLAARERPAV